MSFELVYTSAPRGLKPGSSGFCTVACTKGTPQALIRKLESLSGYDHAYPPKSGKNPVNYSHCTIRVQQQKYHVLSRIADAGDDHTGRSNKIAHHLAIPDSKLSQLKATPASLLADRRFWCQDWTREPQELPPGRMPKPTACSPGDCDAWDTVLGDAGWAGMLAEAGKSPVAVILPSCRDAWDLLTEALQMVSPATQWKIGFSTYFNQAAGDDCHWRFVLDGTEASRKFRGRTAALVIDHKAKKSPAKANKFVAAARAGDPSQVLRTASRQSRQTRQTTQPSRPGSATGKNTAAQTTTGRGRSGRLRPSELKRQQAANRVRQQRQQYSDDDWDGDGEDVHEVDIHALKAGNNRKKRQLVIAVAGIVVCAILGLLAYLFIFKNPVEPETTPADDVTETVEAAE